ncbi:MAG: hypothetical protein WCF22_19945 [Candidatus Sulfotelmatobacter sp.]
MNVVKSIVVGLLFVLGFAVISPLIALAVASVLPSSKDGGSWGWDPVWFARSPLAWAIIVVIFAAGAVWEYRRLLS